MEDIFVVVFILKIVVFVLLRGAEIENVRVFKYGNLVTSAQSDEKR